MSVRRIAAVCTVDALSRALATGQLYLVYQPTFEPVSDRVVAAEALLRWRHPLYGTIAPAAFLPFADESGLSVPIGRWVLQTACRKAASWNRLGHPLAVAVNLSPRQFEAQELAGDVAGALSSSGLARGALTLEIAESTLRSDMTGAAARLRALRSLGVRIAVDGLKPDHASLRALAELPIDAVKIDRALADGHSELVRSVVEHARSLGIATYAEGVEEEHQLRRLRYEQFDYAQGFRFARPLEGPALDKLLDDGALVAGCAA